MAPADESPGRPRVRSLFSCERTPPCPRTRNLRAVEHPRTSIRDTDRRRARFRTESVDRILHPVRATSPEVVARSTADIVSRQMRPRSVGGPPRRRSAATKPAASGRMLLATAPSTKAADSRRSAGATALRAPTGASGAIEPTPRSAAVTRAGPHDRVVPHASIVRRVRTVGSTGIVGTATAQCVRTADTAIAPRVTTIASVTVRRAAVAAPRRGMGATMPDLRVARVTVVPDRRIAVVTAARDPRAKTVGSMPTADRRSARHVRTAGSTERVRRAGVADTEIVPFVKIDAPTVALGRSPRAMGVGATTVAARSGRPAGMTTVLPATTVLATANALPALPDLPVTPAPPAANGRPAMPGAVRGPRVTAVTVAPTAPPARIGPPVRPRPRRTASMSCTIDSAPTRCRRRMSPT